MKLIKGQRTFAVEEIKLEEITEDLVAKTKRKLADLEDRSRQNNLRFEEFQGETN